MPGKRRPYRRRRLRAAVLLLIPVAGLAFFQLRMAPVIAEESGNQAKSYAALVLSETAVETAREMKLSEKELEEIRFDEKGRIASVVTDTTLANDFKNHFTLNAQNALGSIRCKRADIPLSRILGSNLIACSGLSVPAYFSLSGNVRCDFEHSFESGGINQTLHKLLLRITAQINITEPHTTESEEVTTSVILGETVIVGDTPEGMVPGLYNYNK